MDQVSSNRKGEKASNSGLDTEEKRWFAVYTRYKREKIVVQRLREKRIEAYVPLQELTRYYTRKIKKVQLPLISCYVFVKITKEQYVPVLETQDIVSFIKFNKEFHILFVEQLLYFEVVHVYFFLGYYRECLKVFHTPQIIIDCRVYCIGIFAQADVAEVLVSKMDL